MKNMSIRRKLYILILIVLVPLCVLQVMGNFYRYEKAVEAALDSSWEFAQTANAALMNYFHYLWDLEAMIGTSIIKNEQLSDPDWVGAMLGEIDNPNFADLGWVNPDGKVLAGTEHRFIGRDLREEAYFQEILHGKKEVVSDLVDVQGGEERAILLLRGFYQEEQLTGVIVAAVDPDTLKSILPNGRLANSGAYGFADRNGIILYHSKRSDITRTGGKIDATSPVWRSLNGEVAFTRHHKSSLTGERRMGVTIPFPEVGWATFATISEGEVMKEVMAVTIRDILISIIIATVSFWAAIKVADQILQPVGKLQQAATEIAQGNLSVRTRITGHDELAVTGQIFDQMVDRIQKLEIGREIFLQTAAHELRNPMAGVKGMLALIRRKIASGKALTQLEDKFAIMEKEMDRLSSLLNQILEAFRIQREEGLLSLNLQKVNVVEIIQAALTPFQNMVSQCNFVLEVKTFKPLWVMADLQRLEDVFRNLFSNANKYSPDGGDVMVTVSKTKDSALVSVKDSGIGIPRDHLNSIFECFHRAGNLKSNDPGGIGLGLFICEKIVLSHGGTIWVESVEGEGSTFFVQIPLYWDKAEGYNGD